MKHLHEIESFPISTRRSIRRGSIVRFPCGKKSGPYFVRDDGTKKPMTLPGTFEVVRILSSRSGANIYLDVFGIDQTGGEYTVKIKGPTRTRYGVTWRAYSVKLERGN